MLRIRLERIDRQVSQAKLAQAARIPQQVVSLIECGRFVPSPNQLQRLADVLRVQPEDLLKDVVVLGPSR